MCMGAVGIWSPMVPELWSGTELSCHVRPSSTIRSPSGVNLDLHSLSWIPCFHPHFRILNSFKVVVMDFWKGVYLAVSLSGSLIPLRRSPPFTSPSCFYLLHFYYHYPPPQTSRFPLSGSPTYPTHRIFDPFPQVPLSIRSLFRFCHHLLQHTPILLLIHSRYYVTAFYHFQGVCSRLYIPLYYQILSSIVCTEPA